MREKGMTLVEIVVASLLLSWLITAMFSLYHSTQQLMDRVNRVQYAAFLARERLEELLGVGFDGYGAYSWTPAYNPNTTGSFQIVETAASIKTTLGADANAFIERNLTQRVTKLWNMDDWAAGGAVDYRKVEVEVEWNEPTT